MVHMCWTWCADSKYKCISLDVRTFCYSAPFFYLLLASRMVFTFITCYSLFQTCYWQATYFLWLVTCIFSLTACFFSLFACFFWLLGFSESLLAFLDLPLALSDLLLIFLILLFWLSTNFPYLATCFFWHLAFLGSLLSFYWLLAFSDSTPISNLLLGFSNLLLDFFLLYSIILTQNSFFNSILATEPKVM